MYLTELIDGPTRKLLGVAEKSHAFDERLAGNPKLRPGQSLAERAIAVGAYPLFIVRDATDGIDFHDLAGVMAWLGALPGGDVQHGTVFRIDHDVLHPNQGLLELAIEQTIDREFLASVQARGERALLASPYQQLASDYGLDELDRHYERLLTSDDQQERTELVQEGYLPLFASMMYDAWCNKLTPAGLAGLLPIVTNAERLLGTTLWEERCHCHMTLLTDAVRRADPDIAGYAGRALAAIADHLAHLPSDAPAGTIAELHRHRAEVHRDLAEHDPARALDHWRQALAAATAAIEVDACETGWGVLLALVHLPGKGEAPDLVAERIRAQGAVQALAERRCRSGADAFRLVQAYRRLRERLDDPAAFPQADYLAWLERAKTVAPADGSSWSGTSEAGHLFYHAGVELDRQDLVAAAMPHFAALLARQPDAGMQVLYLAQCHEAMALIAAGQGRLDAAAGHLRDANAWWADHLEVIRYHFSSLVHYVEFLERVLDSPLDVPRPALADIRRLAEEAERDGQGHYSGPGLTLARLALRAGDEDEAIFHLTRLCILHELCMDDRLESLRQTPLCTAHARTAAFIDQTLSFFAEVSAGYYLDPQIRWPHLQTMDRAAVATAWQTRQEELRRRPRTVDGVPPPAVTAG